MYVSSEAVLSAAHNSSSFLIAHRDHVTTCHVTMSPGDQWVRGRSRAVNIVDQADLSSVEAEACRVCSHVSVDARNYTLVMTESHCSKKVFVVL